MAGFGPELAVAFERGVGVRLELGQEGWLVLGGDGAASTRSALRLEPTGQALLALPVLDGAGVKAELACSFDGAEAVLDGFGDAFAEVLRVGTYGRRVLELDK